MSTQAISLVLRYSRFTGSTQHVFQTLAHHMNRDSNKCWPSIGLLARETGLCRRTVQRAIHKIEGGGQLMVNRRTGRKRSSIYRLTVGEQLPLPGFHAKEVPPPTGFPCDTHKKVTEEKVTLSTVAAPIQPEKVTLVSPKQEKNPIKTEQEKPLSLMQKLAIPLELFLQYKRMRERIHRPVMEGAEDLIFKELFKLQCAGENPVEVLEQAIMTSSYGLFPIRKDRRNEYRESFAERRSRTSAEAIQTVFGRHDGVAGPIRRTLPPTD